MRVGGGSNSVAAVGGQEGRKAGRQGVIGRDVGVSSITSVSASSHRVKTLDPPSRARRARSGPGASTPREASGDEKGMFYKILKQRLRSPDSMTAQAAYGR